MTWFVIVVFLVVAAAAVAQAVAGFGFALLAMPLLTVVADAPTAVVGTCVVSVIPVVVNVARDWHHVRWGTARGVLLAAVAGLPLGLWILRSLPERALTAVIAVVVLGCVAIVWRSPAVATDVGRARPVLVGFVGVLTGVLTTATGTNGPPLVASLQAMGYGPRALRATLAVVFLGTSLLAAVGFVLADAVTESAVMLTAVGTPAAVVGWFVGDRFFDRLDAASFRRVLLSALCVGALLAVGRVILW